MNPVVYITLDGLRPDAIDLADCPTLKGLRARGAHHMAATSVMPTSTLPCHMSIFHSVPPSRHGITSNTYTPMARPLPGLFEIAFQHQKRTAMFYCWEELRDVARPGTLIYSYFNTSGENIHRINWDVDHDLARKANHYIRTEPVDFVFLYLGTIDIAGHAYGWMSDGYLNQISHVDTALAEFLVDLPEQTTFLLQSDHGGHARDHGTDCPEDMLIPWIVTGPQIKKNHSIQTAVSLLDTAPTLAHLLNIPPHPTWEGRPATEIFEGA